MPYDPTINHRRSIRLKDYDYSQAGAYFVTTVSYGRNCLFGEIIHGEIQLSIGGQIVKSSWLDLPNHYPEIECDSFCIMPNHFHDIIVVTNKLDCGHSLPEIMRGFKTFSARKINYLRRTPGIPVWPKNYYEHIIRDQEDMNCIREYIEANPIRWFDDDENPIRLDK